MKQRKELRAAIAQAFKSAKVRFTFVDVLDAVPSGSTGPTLIYRVDSMAVDEERTNPTERARRLLIEDEPRVVYGGKVAVLADVTLSVVGAADEDAIDDMLEEAHNALLAAGADETSQLAHLRYEAFELVTSETGDQVAATNSYTCALKDRI